MDLTLFNNRGGPGFALTLALMNNRAPESVAESTFADIYWRFDEDEAMEPIYLGRTNAGNALSVPFDPKGRVIRFFAASVTEAGFRFVADYSKMSQRTFSPKPSPESDPPSYEASESITAPALVNIHNVSGTAKIRKANATDNTKPAHGFILEDVASGDGQDVFFGGLKMSGLSGLTPGTMYYLSTTGGSITATAPSSSGNIQQQIGEATGTTEILFEPQPTVKVR